MATNDEGNCKTVGIQSLTSGGVMNGRTLTGTSTGTGGTINITTGSGATGNPSMSLNAGVNTLPTVNSASGTIASLGNSSTSTLFTPSGNGAWLVGAFSTDSTTANIHCLSYVIHNSSNAISADSIESTSCSISISGSNVILTNSAGATRNFAWFNVLLA